MQTEVKKSERAVSENGTVKTYSPKTGTVKQVIGAVVDVYFADGVPEVYTALTVKNSQGEEKTTVLEVAAHLGGNQARCISMETTAGLRRGGTVTSTGVPMQAPVVLPVLGRVWNVLGDVIDNEPAPKGLEYSSIHRSAPSFKEQATKTEIFETGIKAIDLMTPFIKGGKA